MMRSIPVNTLSISQINIKRRLIYLLGDSRHTSNRWKNYLRQVSTFYGIKEFYVHGTVHPYNIV